MSYISVLSKAPMKPHKVSLAPFAYESRDLPSTGKRKWGPHRPTWPYRFASPPQQVGWRHWRPNVVWRQKNSCMRVLYGTLGSVKNHSQIRSSKWFYLEPCRGGSRNCLKGGGGSGPEFFEGGGGVRVQVRGNVHILSKKRSECVDLLT